MNMEIRTRCMDELMDIRCDERLSRMKAFGQHGETDTYEHCCNVAAMALKIAFVFHLKEYKIRNAIVGAMLHDFYLYDYHGARRTVRGFHAFVHPEIALENACAIFDLNDRQKNVIRSHMFPATLFHVPKCAEAWVVNLSDKYCAVREFVAYRLHKKRWEASA